MTNSEIDAMPAGPEMDALVAEKVMGWKELQDHRGVFWDGFRTRLILGGKCALDRIRIGMEADRPGDDFVFSPTVSISDAWQAVEKTKHLIPVIRLCGNGLEWMASYTNSGAYSVSETPMLAICRAALKAVTQ